MNGRHFKVALFAIMILSSAVACGGGGGGGGSDGGGSGAKCSQLTGNSCLPGEFCNYADLTCGDLGTEGRCEAIPVTPCTGPTVPAGPEVCTCPGLTFDNECWASSAGQSIRAVGACQ